MAEFNFCFNMERHKNEVQPGANLTTHKLFHKLIPERLEDIQWIQIKYLHVGNLT